MGQPGGSLPFWQVCCCAESILGNLVVDGEARALSSGGATVDTPLMREFPAGPPRFSRFRPETPAIFRRPKSCNLRLAKNL